MRNCNWSPENLGHCAYSLGYEEETCREDLAFNMAFFNIFFILKERGLLFEDDRGFASDYCPVSQTQCALGVLDGSDFSKRRQCFAGPGFYRTLTLNEYEY